MPNFGIREPLENFIYDESYSMNRSMSEKSMQSTNLVRTDRGYISRNNRSRDKVVHRVSRTRNVNTAIISYFYRVFYSDDNGVRDSGASDL